MFALSYPVTLAEQLAYSIKYSPLFNSDDWRKQSSKELYITIVSNSFLLDLQCTYSTPHEKQWRSFCVSSHIVSFNNNLD